MMYGSETWPVNKEHVTLLERTEMRMIRWMSGVHLRDKITSAELRSRAGVKAIDFVLRRKRLRWFGHVERKEEEDWVKKCMYLDVDGKRPRGRQKKT
jgi:hypothetical protein